MSKRVVITDPLGRHKIPTVLLDERQIHNREPRPDAVFDGHLRQIRAWRVFPGYPGADGVKE